MGKDPAFLFYPGDWLGGTLGMTLEEKGAYMELLMLQFNRGHMTSQVIGQVVGQLWVKVQDKFKIDDKGLYYNERLDIEIQKRRDFVKSRVNNISGKNQYSKEGGLKDGHKGGHMTSHMEDEDENRIEYESIIDYYHTLCPKMNKVQVMNDTRKGYINARIGEYGQAKVIEILRKAGESDFLNGKNDRAWKADFDWIMRPNNFIKIMEGKFNNKQKHELTEDDFKD